MGKTKFDEHAGEYDAWFFDNENLLHSELKLVAHFLRRGERVLSVGCGSGLFEMLLREHYGIEITDGIEPSEGMAAIASKRGVAVRIGTAEDADFGCELYDTILFNGTPSYITDLKKAFEKAHRALKSGGRVIAIDVPKESGYGTMYNLAYKLQTWDDELLRGVHPKDPYPIGFLNSASWRTTDEKIELLKQSGFGDIEAAQTLTTHPLYSNEKIEEPSEGYDRGDYVAICATKL